CGDGLPYEDTATGMTGAGFCYRVIVENCGNDVLNDVTVTNADLGSGNLPGFPTTLAIGEKATNFFAKTCSSDGTHVSTVTATVVVPAGGSSDAIVCEVEVTCPAGTNITVTVTGTGVPSASVACTLDSRGQPIRTAPSTCSASVACQAPSCTIAGDTPVCGNTT